MKIRQVKAFLAVVKTGSVRRASVELNLTQSTVAKAVSQLEAELGSPLFERSAQGLRLNEAGESLLPYAETIVANADKAAAAVSAIATGHFDKLRLSVTPTLPPCILADAMTHFRSRFPETKGSSSKTPVAKPDGTKMFCSAFLNDARMCCFFANAIVKY